MASKATLKRKARRRRKKRRALGAETTPESQQFATVVVPQWNSGQPASTYDDPVEQLEHNKHWVYAAINAIGETVAGTKLEFFVRQKAEGEDEYPLLSDVVSDHPLLKLFGLVNPFMTVEEMWRLTMGFLEMTGDCFWYLPRSGLGVPSELWIAHSQYMKVVPSKTEYISHYEYRRGGQVTKFSRDEIVHIKYPNPKDQWYGLSPLQAAAEQVESYEAIKTAQKKTFDHGAMPGLVISTDTRMEQPDIDRLRRRVDRLYGGSDRAGKTMVLAGGLKAEKVTLSPREMNFLTSSENGRSEVLGVFRVPAGVIGVDKEIRAKATFDGVFYAFLKTNIEPKLRLIESIINEYICPLFDERIFCEWQLDIPKDAAEYRNNWDVAAKHRSVTFDEIRSNLLGLGPATTFDGTQQVGAGGGTGAETPPPEDEGDDSDDSRPVRSNGAVDRVEGDGKTKQVNVDPDELVDAVFSLDEDAEAVERLSRLYVRKAVKRGADLQLKNLGKPAGFDLKSPEAIAYMEKKKQEYWKNNVSAVTREKLRYSLAKGIEEGEGVRDLTKRVSHVMSGVGRSRALTIARTEVNSAMNGGSDAVFKQEKVAEKEWVATSDNRTRDDHRAADGQVVPVSGSFEVGGESLGFPGDPNASAEQVVNCRCAVAGVVAEEGMTAEERKLYRAVHLAAHASIERPWRQKVYQHFLKSGRIIVSRLRKELAGKE